MSHVYYFFWITSILLIVFGIQLIHARSSIKCCEDYCYSRDNDRSQSKHFATKTAYEVIRGPSSSQEHVISDCTPSKFWLLSRHGTRLPSRKDIEVMRPILSDLRDSILDNYVTEHTVPKDGRMCREDLELLRAWHWNPNITVNYELFLTDQGWDDLKLLAMREKDRFPEIFDGNYDEQRYLFRYTNTQRTEASFKAFAEGLFGAEDSIHINTESELEDEILLKPYDFCPAYKFNKDKINQPDSEMNKFLKSPLYMRTLADISTRLGFQDSLSNEQIEAMWNGCRFEQAWDLHLPSPWCSVFTKSQINVIEYKEDLNYYYQNSYGYEHGSDLGCHAMADMMKHLGREDGKRVIAYFTHESAIQIFLVALGAMKDEEALRADNYYSMKDRAFRSSELTPFSANVAVVQYQCADPVEPMKAMFFFNEIALKFDWCNDGLCDWSEVTHHYERFANGACDEMFCRS